MDTEDLRQKINEYNKNELRRARTGETEEPEIEATDIYEENRKAKKKEQETARPHGAPSIVSHVLDRIIKEHLAPAYRQAKDDSELLTGQGEKERAELVESQYMEEHFLPAVETLIMFCSPDEVLNAKSALKTLDSFVLNATGGSGYTASYIKTAYKDILGNSKDLSDETVQRTVARLSELSETGNNRAAFGLARRMKKKIDDGEQIASDADYDLISRVVAFFF